MSNTKKTIQINPELFRLPGNKTRRARDKKELPIASIITPNNLKNKLLKRIIRQMVKLILMHIQMNLAVLLIIYPIYLKNKREIQKKLNIRLILTVEL